MQGVATQTQHGANKDESWLGRFVFISVILATILHRRSGTLARPPSPVEAAEGVGVAVHSRRIQYTGSKMMQRYDSFVFVMIFLLVLPITICIPSVHSCILPSARSPPFPLGFLLA